MSQRATVISIPARLMLRLRALSAGRDWRLVAVVALKRGLELLWKEKRSAEIAPARHHDEDLLAEILTQTEVQFLARWQGATPELYRDLRALSERRRSAREAAGAG